MSMLIDNDAETKPARNEQDTAWKEILDAYFKDFIHYCLPELASYIDWGKPIVSLDKELQAITKGAETGKRLLDKLFKVFLKDGNEQWVLIHVEVQGRKDDDFPKRMFTYAYRIWDKYQRSLVSCALLTDENPDWKPNHYIVEFAGSGLSAKFLTIKMLDYGSQKAVLENSNNPFAQVILVQLVALEARLKSPEERKNIKFMLTKKLYEKRIFKERNQQFLYLHRLVDWTTQRT